MLYIVRRMENGNVPGFEKYFSRGGLKGNYE
jgi:hypothetical protein